jgi:hypothetical protein
MAGTFTGCQFKNNPAAPNVSKPLRESVQAVQKQLDGQAFRNNQMIVFFKGSPTSGQVSTIKKALQEQGIDTATLNVRRCTSCGSPVELWEAAGIHTVINTDGVRSGSGGGGSRGVGEDSLARYSVNFTSQLPVDTLPGLRDLLANYNTKDTGVNGAGKDTIRIAVLDTGIDTSRLVSSRYLWKNNGEAADGTDNDGNCYKDDNTGWNFIDNTGDVQDNNASIHGTIVSQFIINQFRASPGNMVQIMALKTHDNNGFGDLFGSLCALYYAMDKGATIINASWGFYNYGESPVPYLDSIITQVLPQKGVLFVTAAGNKSERNDEVARAIYRAANGGAAIPEAQLRNLDVHNFYPACLSAAQNNVVTVTTTDGRIVSPTQNYSSNYVDLGIVADSVTVASMSFRLPFAGTGDTFISGSSFATAIASGKIGALINKDVYTPGLKKAAVFAAMTSGVVQTSADLQRENRIRNGSYTTGTLVSF